MPKKKSFTFSPKKARTFLLVGILLVVIGGAAAAFSRLGEQVTVNRIATAEMDQAITMKGFPAPEGCHYAQAKCVTTPCSPTLTLVCDSPKPGATCRPRPACLDAKFPCKIADGPGMWCEDKPVVSPACVPIPECPDGRACKQMLPPLPSGMQYCEKPAPSCVPDPCLAAGAGAECKRPPIAANKVYCTTPRPSCVPLPTCPEGRACKLSIPRLPDGQEYCGTTTKPSPSPVACRAKILSITLKDKCETGFRSVDYQCDTDSAASINSQSCMTIQEIQAKVHQDCGSTCRVAKPD